MLFGLMCAFQMETEKIYSGKAFSNLLYLRCLSPFGTGVVLLGASLNLLAIFSKYITFKDLKHFYFSSHCIIFFF